MTSHTPGPWRLDSGEVHPEEYDGKPNTMLKACIARVSSWNGIGATSVKAKEAAANALLIAAAPDLLAAVEAMLAEYEEGRNIQPYEIREMCRAAKFKAYGEDYE